MRGVFYQVLRGWQGLVRRPAGTLLTLGSVALSLVLAGGVFWAAQALEQVTQGWGSGALVAVDLVSDVAPADAARVAQALRETPGVRRVRRVSPAEAKTILMKHLGPDADVVAEVEPSFLPASFEVALGGGSKTVRSAQQRIARMAGVVPGVEAVRTVETWYHQMDQVVRALRWAGLGLLMLVVIACIYIVMTTVRLQIGARRNEIHVLRLVGATERFVRIPFLLEGMAYGGVGALLSLGLLYGVYRGVSAHLGDLVGGGFGCGVLGFLPPAQMALGVGVGMLCGLAGATLATRGGDSNG